MSKLHHDSVLELSWKSIQHNIKHFRSQIKKTTKLMLMIKASGYGSSAKLLGKKIEEEKLADYFGVATVPEGVELRKIGVELPIMVQNPNSKDWELLVKHCLEPVIHNEEGIDSFQNFLHSKGGEIVDYPVHFEVNTGMNRFGFDEGDMDLLMQKLSESKNWRVASVMTHLSSSGDKLAQKFTLHQLEVFNQIILQLKPYLNDKVFFHALNTDGIQNFSFYQMDMIRVGIGLYGASEAKLLQEKLEPIATFSSKVVGIRTVKKDEGISYNRSGTLKKDSNIAVLSLGYADGFPRLLGNGNWEIEINNKLYPTVGDICMDLCMVNIGNDEIELGDKAIIFGGKKSIFSYANSLNTITYEALTNLGSRVKKVIVE